MAAPTRNVWTLGRKLLGNVLPLLLAGPFLFVGIRDYASTGLTGATFVVLMLFPIVAWIATNLLGNVGGWGLKQEIEKLLVRERRPNAPKRLFVGFARPAYRGLLDPHEDLGFLLVHENRLEFFGSQIRLELPKEDIETVTFRPNPHTWLGLGRWISVEGRSQGRPVRLLVEPREYRTLLANKRLGTEWHKMLQEWVKAKQL